MSCMQVEPPRVKLRQFSLYTTFDFISKRILRYRLVGTPNSSNKFSMSSASATFSRFLLGSYHFHHVTAAVIVCCGGATAMAGAGVGSEANNNDEGKRNSKTTTSSSSNGFNQFRLPSFFISSSSSSRSFISSCEPPPPPPPPPSSSSSSYTMKQKQKQKQRIHPLSSADIRKRMTHVGRFSLVIETPSNPMVSVLFVALSGKPFTSQNFIDLYHKRNIDTKYERFRATLRGDEEENNDTNNTTNIASSSSFLDSNNMTHFIIKNKLNLDKIIKQSITYPVMYRKEIKDWAIEGQMEPLDVTQSLWDARIFTGGQIGQSGVIPSSSSSTTTTTTVAQDNQNNDDPDVESLLLFRAHHCMADGVSLGAIFTDLADEGQQLQQLIADKIEEFKVKLRRKCWWQKLQILLYYWWWGAIKSITYQLYLYWKSMINPDPWNQLRLASSSSSSTTNSLQETSLRTISWVQAADLDQLKHVANYFSQYTKGKVTVNDIVCSCVSAATAKLIRYHQSRLPDLQISQLPYMNIVIPVHMQGGILLPNQSLGNNIGALVCRVPAQQIGQGSSSSSSFDYTATNNAAQERLIKVHNALYHRKQTPAAALSYLVAKAFGYVGTAPSTSTMGGTGSSSSSNNNNNGILPWLFEKAHAKASVAITNVRGPEHSIHFDGRRVEAVLGFLPLPAGVPIGIAVFSYNKKLSLTVVGESWAVPDADLYLSWIVEEYQELLQQAANNNRNSHE